MTQRQRLRLRLRMRLVRWYERRLEPKAGRRRLETETNGTSDCESERGEKDVDDIDVVVDEDVGERASMLKRVQIGDRCRKVCCQRASR